LEYPYNALPNPLDIYIGEKGSVLGPYYPDESQKRLGETQLDGTELA